MTTLDTFLSHATIAYFTMEIALKPEIPTYSGGLGILAGDAARTAADLQLPMVFVTLVSRNGYLDQKIDAQGIQTERPQRWDPASAASLLHAKICVEIERRPVWVCGWLYALERETGSVPVLLLDTDLPENDPQDRSITNELYGGDVGERLRQEIVLGIGGEALLRALGFTISVYHMNEGHAALLTLALLRRCAEHPTHSDDSPAFDSAPVIARCVFTTHTPVAAGQDRFDYPLVERLLGDYVDGRTLRRLCGEDCLNMTRLAMNLSGYINGVAERHQETTERMFPGYRIRAITNGVHPETWVHSALVPLFDRLGKHWTHEPEILVRADILRDEALAQAHRTAKAALIALVRDRTGATLDPALPILGFARRMTGYKRADLLLSDPERLIRIAKTHPFQILYGGKAHPHDGEGKELIRRLHTIGRELGTQVPVVFLPGYDFSVAGMLVAGCDLWLNTPLPPLEASGTSGMKAALNGVPSLSVLDGWWVEGCVEGVTGWAIGTESDPPDRHGALLLDKLEHVVLPLYHDDPSGWLRVMKGAIGKAGSIFTSHRMMRRYATEAYLGAMTRTPL